MRARRSTPIRGLLAGLVILIVFASSVVAMTAGGSRSNSNLPASQYAQTVLVAPDSGTRGTERSRGDDAGEADGHDEGRHHR
jgi:hypothetical protein